MPLVRIDLIEKQHAEKDIAAIGDAVQAALIETMNVPGRDRFQVINEHPKTRFIYNSSYLGVERTDGIVFVQVFLSKGRTSEQKRAFYASLARRIASAGIRPEDLAVALVENTREDWSFGNGIAQYVVMAQEEWK